MTKDFFDTSGIPKGKAVHKLSAVGEVSDPTAFAVILDITKTDHLDPFIRFGDVLIISPAATAKNGDHVLLKLNSGELYFKKIYLQGDDVLITDSGPGNQLKLKSLSVKFYHKVLYLRKR
jgi:SOS-response transcriptional repressor LexA